MDHRSPVGATTTKTGLKVECMLDTRTYAKGIKVSKAEMAALAITVPTHHAATGVFPGPAVPSTESASQYFSSVPASKPFAALRDSGSLIVELPSRTCRRPHIEWRRLGRKVASSLGRSEASGERAGSHPAVLKVLFGS